MGQLSLSDIRNKLNITLGDRNLPNVDPDGAINDAYFEVAGGVNFAEFDAIHSFSTVNGTVLYQLPSIDIAAVEYVVRTSNYLNLRWVGKGEFLRQDPGDAIPTTWTRIADNIYLNPTPDAAYSVDVHIRTMPTLLSNDADKTVISSLWDQPIYLLAGHYMYMALGEEDRAIPWYQRAINSLQSRMTEEDFAKFTVGRFNSRFNATPENED